MPSISQSRELAMTKLQSGEWAYVPQPAAPPAIPAPSTAYPAAPNQYLRAPLPADMWQQESDGQRQFHAAAIPQTRIAPLPAGADPIAGAQAASQAIQIFNTTPAKSSGGVTSVGLTMPVEFVSPVSGSIGTGDVRLATAWTAEAANTVFAATPASPSDHVVMGGGGNHTDMTLTGAATVVPQLAIFMTGPTATSTPAGFTQVSTLPIFYKLLSDLNSISPNAGTINNATGWTAVLDFAASNGSAPVVAVGAGFTGSNPGNFLTRILTPFIPPSGSAIFVYVEADQSVAGFFTSAMKYSCTDDQGNSYAQIADVNRVISSVGSQLTVFVAQNVQNVATTITLTQLNGPPTANVNLNIEAVTFTNLQQASPGIPTFQLLQPAQIPLLDASKIASGRLALARGGTNADLSATGGISRVLRQSTVGAAITVSQIAAADLSNGTTGAGAVVLAGSPTLTGTAALPTATLTGKITNYNSIATVSGGLPAEYATVDLTAQSAAITTTTLYAVPAAGQYRLNWNAKVTTAAGVTSTLGPLTIVYTDPDGVVQTITAAAQNSAGTIETSDGGNSTTTVMLGLPLFLNCKSSTNITYAFAYASNAANAMNYNIHLKLESL